MSGIACCNAKVQHDMWTELPELEMAVCSDNETSIECFVRFFLVGGLLFAR